MDYDYLVNLPLSSKEWQSASSSATVLSRNRHAPDRCMMCEKENPSHSLCGGCGASCRRCAQKIVLIIKLGKNCGCVDCGFSPSMKQIRAFDFHHPSDNKESGISDLLGGSWVKVWTEAQKCTPLCVPCHTLRHAANGKGKKGLPEEEAKKQLKFVLSDIAKINRIDETFDSGSIFF